LERKLSHEKTPLTKKLRSWGARQTPVNVAAPVSDRKK